MDSSRAGHQKQTLSRIGDNCLAGSRTPDIPAARPEPEKPAAHHQPLLTAFVVLSA
jgi:hypothetical protein